MVATGLKQPFIYPIYNMKKKYKIEGFGTFESDSVGELLVLLNKALPVPAVDLNMYKSDLFNAVKSQFGHSLRIDSDEHILEDLIALGLVSVED